MLLQTKPKKYQLLKSNRTSPDGAPLYQIKAKTDFGDIKAGTLGGYIQSEKNLSLYDNSWIDEGATVYGEARVQGNAHIQGKSTISDNIVISNSGIKTEDEVSDDKGIKSKNIFVENSDVLNVNTEDGTDNITIKNSNVSGANFIGSNVKIINSTITGNVEIGSGVVINGSFIDAHGLTLGDNVTVTDSKILSNSVGSEDNTIHDSILIGCKISINGFINCDISLDAKNTKIGCGKDSTLNNSTLSGRLHDSLIGFDGENREITMLFNDTVNNICVSESNKLEIQNYSNENLFIGATNTKLIEESICKNTVRLGCANTVDLSQLDIIDKKLLDVYRTPDFSNIGSGQNKINNFNIGDKSVLSDTKITKSSSFNISSNSYVNANIVESSNIHIYAKVVGSISNSNNIYVENNACINSLDTASNLYVCGNATIESFSGNANGLVVNGNSYINGSSVSGGVINSSEYTGSNSVANTIINNSEVNGITSNGKIINNSVISGGEIKYNEYDNR